MSMDRDSISREGDAEGRDESPPIPKIRDSKNLGHIPNNHFANDPIQEANITKSMPGSQSANKGQGINALPNELLDHIFRYLDGPAPSVSEILYEEPVLELTYSKTRDFKTCSLVCRKWRDIVVPRLFRYTCLSINEANLNISSPISAAQPSKFFSSFIQRKNLAPFVTSFTFLIANAETPETAIEHAGDREYDIDFSGFWARVFEVIDPLTVTIVAAPQLLGALTSCVVNMEDAWGFEMPYHILQLCCSSKSKSKSLPQAQILAQNPNTSTVAQAPQAAPRPPPHQQQPPPQPPTQPPTLLTIRPWTTLLLNEGSFISAYSELNFFSLRPPSILPSLVGIDPLSVSSPPYSGVPVMSPPPPKMPSTIASLSYIALFPTSSHISLLTTQLPALTRLFTQFVPRDLAFASPSTAADLRRQRLLFDQDRGQDPDRYIDPDPDIGIEPIPNIDPNDLWMERNSSYALIMRELFATPPAANWAALREFESGDSADADAWNMAVEYVRRAGGGWRVEREGVFVKDEGEDDAVAAGEGRGEGLGVNGGEGDGGEGEGRVPSLLLVAKDA